MRNGISEVDMHTHVGAKCAAGGGTRDIKKEALAALNFWQALEYLAPQSPPDVKPDEAVWDIDARMPAHAMPWVDATKRAVLRKHWAHHKFQVFAGIVSGEDLIEYARAQLGADAIDMAERMPPSPAACLVIGLDAEGRANGQVFVSSLPWAMARLTAFAGRQDAIDFRGFLGLGGLGLDVAAKVRGLLAEKRILASPDSPPPQDDEAGNATRSADAGNDAVLAALPEADTASSADADALPLRSITTDDIAEITEMVFDLIGWKPRREMPWRIRGLQAPIKATDADETLDDPLNSFYAEDLERVTEAVASDKLGAGLQAYLRGEDSKNRTDLEQHVDALIAGVHPSRLPLACWPSRSPLVTAQQFAVNAVMEKLADGSGIFSVNGPPGTGKTTMLKDIIADVVLRRALRMAEFANPADAFGDALKIAGSSFEAFTLDARLGGHGVVVASANNGAVENITKELPGLGALAPGYEVDYFSVVADSVAADARAKKRPSQPRTWGLTAAVLGSKTKRARFARRFWTGGGHQDSATSAEDPLRFRSLRDVLREKAHDAKNWAVARREFQTAVVRVNALVARAVKLERYLSEREQIAARCSAGKAEADSLRMQSEGLADACQVHRQTELEFDHHLHTATARRDAIQKRDTGQATLDLAAQSLHATQALLDTIGHVDQAAALTAARATLSAVREDQAFHLQRRPGFLFDLFRTPSSKRWHARDTELESQANAARAAERAAAALAGKVAELRAEAGRKQSAVDDAQDALNALIGVCQANGVAADHTLADLDAAVQSCRDGLAQTRGQIAQDEATIQLSRARCMLLDGQLVQDVARLAEIDVLLCEYDGEADAAGWRLAQLDRDALHCAAPYETPALFDARRALFVAALELHKSFIAAAGGRLTKTLGVFASLLFGNISPQQSEGVLSQLWDTFFLVVPVVSTTFASLPRLFAGLGQEELAWLLIDEAGQAAPQQAVGGIWRARRTVVVGDPLQLEPVISVPDEIVAPLLKRCSSEEHWAPPAASTQTLADRDNQWGMYLRATEDADPVWLGAPLRVHRRCIEPMFGIANQIAYAGKMVYGAGAGNEMQEAGASRWIDVSGADAEGHWVPAQAQVALDMVLKLTHGSTLQADGKYKVFVITPFKLVARKMEALLSRHVASNVRGEVKHIVGTVHTFQGKEADHVIFLLGGDPKRPGVISSFAGAQPNLVNVAVTRAKRRLYVVGDRDHWTGTSDVHGIFTHMAERLPVEQEAAARAQGLGQFAQKRL